LARGLRRRVAPALGQGAFSIAVHHDLGALGAEQLRQDLEHGMETFFYPSHRPYEAGYKDLAKLAINRS
jgi:hypothetical protein